MNPKQLFSFEDLASGDKATREVKTLFNRGGRSVSEASIDAKIKKSSGISYCEMLLTFLDSQTVSLRIKETGDIFQVLLNGKVIPIRNQDDHKKAIAEIIAAVATNSQKFQLALTKVKPPKTSSVKTSTPNKIIQLTAQRDELKTEIEAVNAEILAIAV
ncbi:MAG: hypothetical protein WCL34_16150, partial [Methylococcaceae bacterium]